MAAAGKRRRFGTTWWGQAWVQSLEGRAALDPNRLPRGRTYARSGAVGALSVAPGLISAQVQGSRRRPYDVAVRVRQFDAVQWGALVDLVAAQVGHAAALLDGELPTEIVDDAAAAGLELLPGPGDLQPRCSCPDWADPCKHSAAVCYLMADSMDADPFALLLLRGLGRDEFLARVRVRRGQMAGLGAGAGAVGGRTNPALDQGVRASQVWAADRDTLPALPRIPMPPARPGRASALLGTAPPPATSDDLGALDRLATDAIARAHALALGDGVTHLDLNPEMDLARWASTLIGRPDFEVLARGTGMSGRELFRRALGWRYGGEAGVRALLDVWHPGPDALAEGRTLLGDGARVWRNRVTLGDRQVRLGRDGRWYPFRKSGVGWDPAGPPTAVTDQAVNENLED